MRPSWSSEAVGFVASCSTEMPAGPTRPTARVEFEDLDEGIDRLLHCEYRTARDPARVTLGRMLLAGNWQAVAVDRVVAVDDDGQVHFSILPGPIRKNRHLLDRTPG
jgi:hypothetical protein